MDPSIAPFTANVAVTLSNTGTYKMQFCLDADTVPDADAHWFDSVGFPADTATSGTAALTSPVARVRFDISALNGTLTVQILQGFSIN